LFQDKYFNARFVPFNCFPIKALTGFSLTEMINGITLVNTA
jgi:hypothetical protein